MCSNAARTASTPPSSLYGFVRVVPMIVPPRGRIPETCPAVAGYTCSTLDVPLDHSGRHHGTLHLRVGASDVVNAPRGVLLVLAGGPGQPGLPILDRFVDRALAAEQGEYRIVVYDQRGTGAGALDCPAMQ